MTHWRRFLVGIVGALSLAGISTAGVAADEGGTVITYQSMTTVAAPFLAPAMNDRGLVGGGIPWVITSGTGTVTRDGHVTATVVGLVLANVPAAGSNAGTNPIHTFAAVVSCRTTAQTVANVRTPGVPATTAGDASIDTTVDLPRPCTTPEVFVGGLIGTAPNQVFRWFAVSNGDFADNS
ncbi:MAG TPA: hypothetical protein VFJ79_06885 [Acidimicrobiales bacterium]|nr:hypothetical protein [Acidimicrobiales bacterium]